MAARIHHVSIPLPPGGKDAARRFYGDLLGLEEVPVPDTLNPVAAKAINRREDPNRQMFNSVTISENPIPPAEEGADREVWGIATFEDVDPHTDEFSIYIQGLTNAYKMEIKDGERKYRRKTLKINFWSPGDEFCLDESEIRYGVPGKVDYEWLYM